MKIAVVFPGYGNQDVGMGRDLYAGYPIVREHFQKASDYLNIDFQKLCFSAPQEELNKINSAYLSTFLLSSSIYKLLEERGIKATMVTGYDSGQYAALYAAQGISFYEGLDLLQTYAQLYMDLLATNGYDILKINGLTSTKLPEFLDNRTHIAAYLSRTQHIVSGTKSGIYDLREKLKDASSVTLYDETVGIGLHSELMNPASVKFIPHLNKANIKNLTTSLISNITGAPIIDKEQIIDELTTLITNPIKWDLVVDTLSEAKLVLAAGVQNKSFLNLITEQYPDASILAINNMQDLEKIKIS